ncbi:MAG: EamA family transporter [Chloroflexi bacterium]|nr:EamA family transporter [Chloroflexota bacterium]
MNPKLRDWVIFSALGLTWGSSFLWIKIAVQETAPLTVVGLRLLFGWLGMLGVVLWRRTPLPRDRVTLLRLSVLGLLQTALPFALITWGETRIDSGLASILNGSMPLFTMVIAHLALHDEKITLPRLGGLTAGFVGVVVLVSRDLNPQGPGGGILGQLAVLAASLSYAVAVVYSRGRLRNLPPIVQSFGVLTVSEALVWASALTFTRPIRLPAHALTWLAVAWLGLLGSCLAYIMFFHLINAWGPTRASLVT